MATSSEIHLDATQHPQFYLPAMSQEAANKASQLLQDNHEKHHIFFNKAGFHVCRPLLPLLKIAHNECLTFSIKTRTT
jgi:regulator of replication initiation timing